MPPARGPGRRRPCVARMRAKARATESAPAGQPGILKDPEFLLYYKTVQDQIKKAWTFTGGSKDLTAAVDFAIGPDGALTGVKIGKSSNDAAFDDSVIRAISRAAPFPRRPKSTALNVPPVSKRLSARRTQVSPEGRLMEVWM